MAIISHGLPIFVLLFELYRLYLYALFSVGYLARHTEKNRQLPISLILSIGESRGKTKEGEKMEFVTIVGLYR